MWERSFVAVSVLLGASIDEVAEAMPEGTELRLGELGGKLRDSRRAVRAQSLAAFAHEIALALGEVTLR